MNSQLNPNAAEFVPVSPTKLMMDDPIIASSPARGFEKSLDNIQLPSELEFTSEISQRPGDLEYSNGPKHGDDYFETFSTFHNKSKEFNLPSAVSELENKSTLNSNEVSQENVPFDKLAAVQNIEEKVTSAVLEKANIFGINNDFSNNAFEATNIFGKSDPMTASFMGKDLPSSPEPKDVMVSGTPRSTTVKAPGSPITDDTSPAIHQTELDSPADDFAADTQKSPDLISPGDGPQEGLISTQERTSSSGFESESGADEVEPNTVSNEGFITEHRRSPPIDLSFKPIQTFSDTNPFGVLQTPSSTTPLDQFASLESHKEPQFETMIKDSAAEKDTDQFDFMRDTPSSFVPNRLQEDLPAVPSDQLESPSDGSGFENPPNANSSFLTTELPKSGEGQDTFANLSPVKSDPCESENANYQTNVNNVTQNLFSDDSTIEVEETSFTNEKTEANEMSHVDLDSTEGFIATESKIMQDEKECEQTSKLDEDLKINSEPHEAEVDIPSPVSPKVVEQVLAAFDDIKVEPETETRDDFHKENRDSDLEVETKEMKLEFESHIADSQQTPEELRTLDEGFEVINKDELTQESAQLDEFNGDVKPHDDSVIIVEKKQEDIIDLTSPVKETNPFKMVCDYPTTEPIPEECKLPVGSQDTVNNDFMSAIDQFSEAINENAITSVNSALLSSSLEPHLQSVEPEATITVSYQTLTPANEPQISKSESYITGEEEKVDPSVSEEVIKPIETPVPTEEKEPVVEKEEITAPAQIKLPVLAESVQKIEPAQSTVVTETLITALEETSEVPSVATTEVPSSAGTPPPTPAPGLDDSKELVDTPKTDILVAAVAAAGAVAAGSAILAEKEGKKMKEVPAKKSPVGTKKPSDVQVKSAAKPTTTKAPAPKTAVSKTTTTTSKLSTTKPAPGTTKPPSAKLSATSVALKKPTTGAAAKPATAKPASSATPKTVPKQLPINKTTPSTLNPPSKSSTPTTPTTPKSPFVKSDPVKSPARPGLKSPLAAKTSSSKPATEKVTEKKLLTNGDIKPLPKKTEVPKKAATTTTRPPVTKSAPAPKTSGPATKSTAPKPLAANGAKTKPAVAPSSKPSGVAAKRPSTAPVVKISDKSGKETVNKQVSSAKLSMNGKSGPTKPGTGLKKTDPKLNTQSEVKPPPIKKPEEMKKVEEKPVKVQEADVTTTNGFADHNEDHESLKIEDLAPLTSETVN